MAAESTKTLFVVDDHPSVREGIRGIAERSGRFRVLGEAGSGEAGLEAIGAMASPPDLCLVDLNLPGMGGVEFVGKLAKAHPQVRCLVITMSLRFESMMEAFGAGALGFIGKDQDASAILRCLDAVARGDPGLEGEVLRIVVDNARRLSKHAASADRLKFDTLTPREKDVFRLVALNKNAWEIADDLSLSAKTVENVRSAIYTKMGIHDRLDLYRYAVKIGLIEE